MHAIIIERKTPFPYQVPGCLVVDNREFITNPDVVRGRRVRIINLSKDYSYLGYGYYCSLLAEARKQKVIPSVETLLELRERSIYSYALPDLDDLLRQQVRKTGNGLPAVPFTVHVFLGRAEDDRFREVGRRAFDRFRCPILKISVSPESGWHVASVRPATMEDLNPQQLGLFEEALRAYTHASWRSPKSKTIAKYSLAVLYNPEEQMGPSNARALQKFVRIGESLGVEVELIQRKDYSALAEYDALFIRETTAIDHHTFRFAKKAEMEGMPVMDDPTSILRCTNKVYLAELLKANKVPIPKTVVLDKRNAEAVEREIPYPVVLKIPDGSFSRGVVKAENREQLLEGAAKLFKDSDVILAQEYIFTEFDWRVGILRGEPLYVCQYMIAPGHWKVVKYETKGQPLEGTHRTFAVGDAPQDVVKLAVNAARIIGDGFYGVDLKETPRGLYVMEINDNPSIDAGVEDAVLGDELYRKIIQEFIRRLEERPAPSLAPPVDSVTNGNGEPMRAIAADATIPAPAPLAGPARAIAE